MAAKARHKPFAKWVGGKETKRAGGEDEGKKDGRGHATSAAKPAACVGL